MYYDYGKEMLTGRVKPIRIIGDPDNQRPDECSSTVLYLFIWFQSVFNGNVNSYYKLIFVLSRNKAAIVV